MSRTITVLPKSVSLLDSIIHMLRVFLSLFFLFYQCLTDPPHYLIVDSLVPAPCLCPGPSCKMEGQANPFRDDSQNRHSGFTCWDLKSWLDSGTSHSRLSLAATFVKPTPGRSTMTSLTWRRHLLTDSIIKIIKSEDYRIKNSQTSAAL